MAVTTVELTKRALSVVKQQLLIQLRGTYKPDARYLRTLPQALCHILSTNFCTGDIWHNALLQGRYPLVITQVFETK